MSNIEELNAALHVVNQNLAALEQLNELPVAESDIIEWVKTFPALSLEAYSVKDFIINLFKAIMRILRQIREKLSRLWSRLFGDIKTVNKAIARVETKVESTAFRPVNVFTVDDKADLVYKDGRNVDITDINNESVSLLTVLAEEEKQTSLLLEHLEKVAERLDAVVDHDGFSETELKAAIAYMRNNTLDRFIPKYNLEKETLKNADGSTYTRYLVMVDSKNSYWLVEHRNSDGSLIAQEQVIKPITKDTVKRAVRLYKASKSDDIIYVTETIKRCQKQAEKAAELFAGKIVGIEADKFYKALKKLEKQFDKLDTMERQNELNTLIKLCREAVNYTNIRINSAYRISKTIIHFNKTRLKVIEDLVDKLEHSDA